MLNCTDCRTLLVDYERGELDAARDAAVYAHLQACPECSAEWRADLAITESLRAMSSELTLPTAVIAGVRQAMHAERPPSLAYRLRTVFRPAFAAPVAAAVLIAGGILGYHRIHELQTIPTLTGMDYVREHIAQTIGLPNVDRTWSTYVLTSANAGDSADAGSPPSD